jgi:hypothetical protein
MLLKQLLGPSDFTNGAVTARFPTEGAIAITILNQSNFFYQAWADDSNLVGLINPWQRLVIRLTRREQNITLVPLANQPGPSYPQSSIYIGQLPEAPSIDMVNRYEPSIVSATGNKIVELTGSLPGGSNLLGSVGTQVWNGVEWLVRETSSAMGDADAGNYSAGTSPRLWNGSSYDRQYNNTQGTLLASATRTSNAISPTMTNFNARGLQLQLNVTGVPSTPSSGSGLAVQVWGYDVGGNSYALNVQPSNVTAVGEYVYTIYPGASGTTAQIELSSSQPLPRQWAGTVGVTTSDAYTYSLMYSLID